MDQLFLDFGPSTLFFLDKHLSNLSIGVNCHVQPVESKLLYRLALNCVQQCGQILACCTMAPYCKISRIIFICVKRNLVVGVSCVGGGRLHMSFYFIPNHLHLLKLKLHLQATSEYSAERQLNELLFPRIHPKQQKMKQTHQNEC